MCGSHQLYLLLTSSMVPALGICPGRHYSDNSLYLTISCLLAVYDIEPPVDDQGNIIKLKPEFTSGITS